MFLQDYFYIDSSNNWMATLNLVKFGIRIILDFLS